MDDDKFDDFDLDDSTFEPKSHSNSKDYNLAQEDSLPVHKIDHNA